MGAVGEPQLLSRPPSPFTELEAQGPQTGLCLAPPLCATARLAPREKGHARRVLRRRPKTQDLPTHHFG